MEEIAQAALDISLHIFLIMTVEVNMMTDFHIMYPYITYKYRQDF
jgi:hypothetical protein